MPASLRRGDVFEHPGDLRCRLADSGVDDQLLGTAEAAPAEIEAFLDGECAPAAAEAPAFAARQLQKHGAARLRQGHAYIRMNMEPHGKGNSPIGPAPF